MLLLNMLMEIALPKMGELLMMMMMTMISPSGREVPSAELLRRRAKVLLPKLRPKMARSNPKVLSLFFLGQNDLYTRRWAPEVGQGAHEVGACLGGKARPPPSWEGVAPW